MKDMERLVEFYMNNLILVDLNFWDPNSSFLDIKLMELAYWLTHEVERDEEVKKVMEKKEKDPLYIR